MAESMAKKITAYFLGEYAGKAEKMLLRNGCRQGFDEWLKLNAAAGILLAVISAVAAHFYVNSQLVALLSFFIAVPLPLAFSFMWLSYRDEIRKRGIEEAAADMLLYASSLPEGTPLRKSISLISKAGYGTLSDEFAKAGREMDRGLSVPEALERMTERNGSEVLSRAAGMLIEAYYSGGDMRKAFKGIAEDIMETDAIRRERASALIIEKYTLLSSAGLILPAVLAMVTKLVSGLDFGLLSEMNIGLSQQAREALFGAAVFSMPVYLTEYCVLASLFIAFQEGNIRKAFIYAIILAPSALAVHFIIRGVI
jgi:Flp pilus assembly protein TadB